MILAGVLDKFPSLKIMLVRLASCINHDPVVASRLKHNARYYLRQLYFDAVICGSEELGFVNSVIGRSSAYSVPSASASAIPSLESEGKLRALGSSRMLFGTDHPFFPPLKGTDKWKSVTKNLAAINGVAGWGDEEEGPVCGGNTLRIFGLA
jgi:aminocarboxymuconate-semialdehyde decarboxylase